MSALDTVTEQPPVVAAVVELKPKNANRLHRIFRKPKGSLAPRPWRSEEDKHAAIIEGVTAAYLQQLVADLTESEKTRAEAGQDPLSATQEALAQRAARFGLPLPAAVAPKGPTFVVDEETLQRRAARFGTAAKGTAALTMTLSEEDRAAMEARAARFGQ